MSAEALARVTLQLHRQRLLRAIPLAPHQADELAELAASHLGGPIESELAERLHTLCDGNPFFAEELLRDWLDRGAIESSALAFHFARSADRAKGALYSQRAAEQALYTCAPAEAIAHFGRRWRLSRKARRREVSSCVAWARRRS